MRGRKVKKFWLQIARRSQMRSGHEIEVKKIIAVRQGTWGSCKQAWKKSSDHWFDSPSTPLKNK